MKSTFSRQVGTTVLILLLALLLLGGAFRVLVGQYLEHNTHDQLQTDALALAELVAAYDAAGTPAEFTVPVGGDEAFDFTFSFAGEGSADIYGLTAAKGSLFTIR